MVGMFMQDLLKTTAMRRPIIARLSDAITATNERFEGAVLT